MKPHRARIFVTGGRATAVDGRLEHRDDDSGQTMPVVLLDVAHETEAASLACVMLTLTEARVLAATLQRHVDSQA